MKLPEPRVRVASMLSPYEEGYRLGLLLSRIGPQDGPYPDGTADARAWAAGLAACRINAASERPA